MGSLAALNFARQGCLVDVYEYREDIRTSELVQGRSINLALSERGRKALATVGLEDVILSNAIPMKGRMLHHINGSRSVVIYDPCTKQCLYSVGRKLLNEILLNGIVSILVCSLCFAIYKFNFVLVPKMENVSQIFVIISNIS